MPKKAPHNFEYHKYLQKILGKEDPNSSFYIATEKDFSKGPGIDYPYRSYFYALGLMHGGTCRIKIGINEYEIKKQSLTIVGPGIVRQWTENNWQVKNHTFFFKPEFFREPFYNNFLVDYPFFKPGANHVIHLIDEDYKKACELIAILAKFQADNKISQGLFFSLLEFTKQVHTVATEGLRGNTRNLNINNQFIQLLHTYYQHEKEVSFYAGKLNLTPKNLSEILKKETGKSAKQLIDEFVIFDAKSLLKQTQLSIKEIVYWLGYEDPSYFTKLFKTKVGTTPLEYRKK